jgi:hypothetical protein
LERKTNTKTKIKFQKGIRKEKIENTKERKINNKMNKFETMAIPIEADGIVDDQEAFEDQQDANEAQLKEEIASAQQDQNELYDEYEDIEFVPYKETNETDGNKELKLAKRKKVLGRSGFKVFAKIAA